jgi:HJR/Mrr/RecB family endonuclease
MYESVRSINKKVNDFAADLIAKIEGEGKPAADQVAKKVRAAGKKAAKTADTVAEKVEESVS